jgi:hypothetical protein
VISLTENWLITGQLVKWGFVANYLPERVAMILDRIESGLPRQSSTYWPFTGKPS